LQKAREVLDRNNLTPEERAAYDYAMEMRSKDLSDVSSARDEGLAEGREEGLAKGREEGREEGRIEREKLEKELEREHAEREKERENLLSEIARLKQLNKKHP
jgi:predicted transposase YdaD